LWKCSLPVRSSSLRVGWSQMKKFGFWQGLSYGVWVMDDKKKKKSAPSHIGFGLLPDLPCSLSGGEGRNLLAC